MLFYLLPELVENRPDVLQANYDYYTARIDHTFGSSLGPSIQAIMACKAGDPAAYEHFMRAARADLFDVRGNAGDGIHGASAGGYGRRWSLALPGCTGLLRFGRQVHTCRRIGRAWRLKSLTRESRGVLRSRTQDKLSFWFIPGFALCRLIHPLRPTGHLSARWSLHPARIRRGSRIPGRRPPRAGARRRSRG
jgi:hypothetical protein